MRLFALALILCSWSANAAQLTDGLLGHLVGRWTISGTTLGRRTHTGAEVTRVLDGAFVEMHLLDPLKQDHYEAFVFFGEDAAHDLVVHWLDTTGGETSRTLGSGQVSGESVSLTFPYPDGVFRDRFTYDPAGDRWRLLIEMGPVTHPKTFSDWSLSREKVR